MKLTTLFASIGLAYATTDTKVISCTNADTQSIEMTMHIEKALFDVMPAGLTDFDATYYQAVWSMDQLDEPVFLDDDSVASFGKTFDVPKKTFIDASGVVIQVWPSVVRSVACHFSIEDQNMSTNDASFTVTGSDIFDHAKLDAGLTGALVYNINVEVCFALLLCALVFISVYRRQTQQWAINWCSLSNRPIQTLSTLV